MVLIWKNVENFGKMAVFPDRGYTTWADMAGLGSIGLIPKAVLNRGGPCNLVIGNITGPQP